VRADDKATIVDAPIVGEYQVLMVIPVRECGCAIVVRIVPIKKGCGINGDLFGSLLGWASYITPKYCHILLL